MSGKVRKGPEWSGRLVNSLSEELGFCGAALSIGAEMTFGRVGFMVDSVVTPLCMVGQTVSETDKTCPSKLFLDFGVAGRVKGRGPVVQAGIL